MRDVGIAHPAPSFRIPEFPWSSVLVDRGPGAVLARSPRRHRHVPMAALAGWVSADMRQPFPFPFLV
jgi:hypothetical protein